MDFKQHKTIEEYFHSLDGSRPHIFPNNTNYVIRYKSISQELMKWIHPYVVPGAISIDGGYLNDHGPEHIQKVILRVTELLRNTKVELREYEIYLLLIAIQIHDVGNILGRNGHEINSMEVITQLGINAGQDRIEWDCIFEIAEAHGGEPKDKIDGLTDEKILDYYIRKKLLASLLKFADELADDRTRANRFGLISSSLPPESLIFHKYSFCLHSVDIDNTAKQIKLSFDVEQGDVCSTYSKYDKDKNEKQVHLIDEIYARTFKMHLERMYCMRFLRPEGIQIDKIRVDIKIQCPEKDSRNRNLKKRITYDLGEVGYPKGNIEDIYNICPNLRDFTGEKVMEMIKNNTLQDVTATF